MTAIIIQANPTAAQVTAAIRQRFSLETSQIENLQWVSPGPRDSAQWAVRHAYDSANACVTAIQNTVANPGAAGQQVAAAYEQLCLNYIAAIVKYGNSPESRQSLCDSGSTQLASSWQTLTTTIQSAPNAEQAIQTALTNLEQATSFVNEVGTVAINIPLRSQLRATLSTDYPGKLWSELTPAQQESATTSALARAGLTDADELIEIFGVASVVISVGLAFLDSANSTLQYAVNVSKSLLEIGADYVGGNLASNAYAASDASDILAGLLGTEGEVVAALIPVGFGIVIGVAVSALADVLFNLIFGVGPSISPSLEVAVTIPITVPVG